MPKPSEDQVRERAYQLWEQSGRPHGQELDHWLSAEAELKPARKGRAKAGAKPAAARKATGRTKRG